MQHSDPTGSPPRSLCRCCARTTCCTCGDEVVKTSENRCSQPCPHYTCQRHQIWKVAPNGLPIPGCNHCMGHSPLVSANSSMVAPTHPYPSEGGSPPKPQVHANRGISAWSKPGGGAPAPDDGGGYGSGWPGSSGPSGQHPFQGDPNPPPEQDPPDYHGVPHSLQGNTPETIQKSRKEIPKLSVPQNITSMPAYTVRQTFEEWVVRATLAVTTWTLTMIARDHFVTVVKEARKNLKLWQNAPHQEKLKMELSYLHGAERPVPPRVSSIEAIMRVELLEKLPPWLARKCTIQGHYNTVDVLSK
eukprot:5298827-Amphidinium_carterae.1